MSPTTDLTRRRALQFLGAAPMLPVAASLAGWSGLAEAYNADLAYTFSHMAAPTLANPAQMATTYTAGTLTRTVKSSGKSIQYSLGYVPFFYTGQTVAKTGGGTILTGGYVDMNGNPIIDTSVAGAERQFFSDAPDGLSLLSVPGASSATAGKNRVFAVVQFEYTTRNQALASMYGMLPSPIAVLSLDQDQATGQLSLVSYHNVDTSSAHGLWITCGASRSPWGTHLSSEEYEPDAFLVASASANSTKTQFQGFSTNTFGNATTAKPYHYGHLPEVTVHADGTGSIKKHYCLGRISHELVHVCPDQRTVLMGDDATNGGAFMFLADNKADLSAGTLYVAKLTQTSPSGVGTGTFTLQWIELGHATSAEIEALADSLTVGDIMDISNTDPADSSYTKIRFNGANQWVRVKAGMEKAAAFLETHRYAAVVGASMVFTKWEGTTVNQADKKAYVAMAAINKSMVDGTTDIKVATLNAGAVYVLNLRNGQKTKAGKSIKSNFVPVDMAAVPELVGVDLSVADSLGNLSDADKVANPDNLKYSESMRTLFIGEDSGRHVNNFLWAYNVDTKALSRILSCPVGAESVGLHAVDGLNGFQYITSCFQHVGDWESPLHNVVKPTLDPLVRANYNDRFSSAVGYLALAAVK